METLCLFLLFPVCFLRCPATTTTWLPHTSVFCVRNMVFHTRWSLYGKAWWTLSGRKKSGSTLSTLNVWSDQILSCQLMFISAFCLTSVQVSEDFGRALARCIPTQIIEKKIEWNICLNFKKDCICVDPVQQFGFILCFQWSLNYKVFSFVMDWIWVFDKNFLSRYW